MTTRLHSPCTVTTTWPHRPHATTITWAQSLRDGEDVTTISPSAMTTWSPSPCVTATTQRTAHPITVAQGFHRTPARTMQPQNPLKMWAQCPHAGTMCPQNPTTRAQHSRATMTTRTQNPCATTTTCAQGHRSTTTTHTKGSHAMTTRTQNPCAMTTMRFQGHRATAATQAQSPRARTFTCAQYDDEGTGLLRDTCAFPARRRGHSAPA